MAIRKRGKGHYEVVVYAGLDPNTGRQRQVSRTVRGSRDDAKAKERELAAGVAIDQGKTRDVPFGALTERWLKVARHEASTRYQTDYYLRKHILPRWRNVDIGDIRAADLDAWYGQLESDNVGLAPTTIRRIHGIVSAALEQAVRWGWLDVNPARRTSPPEGGRAPLVVPSGEQVFAALEKLWLQDKDLWCFVRVAAATGMRRGEVCALMSTDVLPGAVRKARAIGEAKGGAYEKSTKTGVAHLVAVDRRTEAVLRWQAWRMRTRIRLLNGPTPGDQPRGQRSVAKPSHSQPVGRHTERAGAKRSPLGTPTARASRPDYYLFSAADDCSRPWNPNAVSKRFRRIVGPGISLRHLRHYVASELISGGVDVTTVAHRLGHARTSTTTDVYAALLPASDRAAAEAIGRKLSR